MSVGANFIDLKWENARDNVAVTGYEVWNDMTNSLIEDIGNKIQYTVTGLTSGTEYRFKVRAYDAAGNYSSYSNIITQSTI